jgi:hypothetical protein
MAASLEPEDESLEGWALSDNDGDATYVDMPTVRSQLLHTPIKKVFDQGSYQRGRSARKRRKKNDDDDGDTSCATPGSPSVPAVSLQPLLDFLASKYASVDSEDSTFDDVAGSVLAQYRERRDELEERHERDDLVSTLYS